LKYIERTDIVSYHIPAGQKVVILKIQIRYSLWCVLYPYTFTQQYCW